ncbi:uncharacterized protein LOC135133930 [Zophobas morio]|uniref:uncharacterized protein LOC135133930 n=1 Tax=Zophobas morio TaxID=2755281 RepID=UPI003083DA0A
MLDYYWRDYNGTIPHDALVAGQDGQHRNVFIGQAYIRNLGLIVIHITPGEREFYVAVRGVHKVHNHIRILCGKQPDFSWVPATARDLFETLRGRHGIIGGHEDDCGPIHIGRIKHEGGVLVGKINSFIPRNAYLMYPENHWQESREIHNYEVLVYNKCTC